VPSNGLNANPGPARAIQTSTYRKVFLMRLSVINRSSRHVIACVFAALAVAIPLAVAHTAQAATFGCGACNNVSGPNQSMEFTEGINYNHYNVWVKIWKYNGGSNYNVSNEGLTTSNYKLTIASGCGCYLTGHGQVLVLEESSHIGGNDF